MEEEREESNDELDQATHDILWGKAVRLNERLHELFDNETRWTIIYKFLFEAYSIGKFK